MTVATEKARLRGEWTVKAMFGNGGNLGGGFEKNKPTIKFTDDKMTYFLDGKQRDEFTYTLDVNATPTAIDLVDVKTKETRRGIYGVDGDTLKICFNEEKDGARPKKFETDKGTKERGMVLTKKNAK